MSIPRQQLSAGCQELLRTTPEYHTRYKWAQNLMEGATVRELRAPGAPLAREYSSWKNAGSRDGLHTSISKFPDFMRIHGPMPDDTGKWSLDRIQPRGSYHPSNIRWQVPLGQTRNRTNTLTLQFYEHEIYLQDAAHALGVPYKTVYRLYTRDKSQLITRLEKWSFRLLYKFPEAFREELENEYLHHQKSGGNLMRLYWIMEFACADLDKIAEELEDHPDSQMAREKHENAFSVVQHALAFDKWAEKQMLLRIAFLEDARGDANRPEWAIIPHFEPAPPPVYV